jgi:hypothetical protein
MTFQSGHVANPNGRPKGARNKRSIEIFDKLQARGDLDPAEHLSSIVSDLKASPELRAQAANFLLPYKYSKCGSTPPLRYIEEGSLSAQLLETEGRLRPPAIIRPEKRCPSAVCFSARLL